MAEFDSSFDTLTGLYNRAVFKKTSERLAGLKPVSLIMLDIDDFKSINDNYGHDQGDQVIKAVATIIRQSFSKRYICYQEL